MTRKPDLRLVGEPGLDPCPFCGEGHHLHEFDQVSGERSTRRVMCMACSAEAPKTVWQSCQLRAVHLRLQQHAELVGTEMAWQERCAADRNKSEKGPTNLQLFCNTCKRGAGDERQQTDGDLVRCPYCESTGPFVYSWELFA